KSFTQRRNGAAEDATQFLCVLSLCRCAFAPLREKTLLSPSALNACQLLQTILNRVPCDVGEESLNVFRSLGGLVVEQKCMLPNVHHEDRREAGDVAGFMQRDPVI